ncbi:hypothetical protein GW932_02510 [archaeon]|nr:hypothetical protein [archaeon]
MKEVNKRIGTHMANASPRACLESNLLAESVRKERMSLKSSFTSEKISSFQEGYDLVGLKNINNYSNFFEEKGIYYVNGLIKRFSSHTDSLIEEGTFENIFIKMGLHPLSKAYRKAKKFKKDYGVTRKI